MKNYYAVLGLLPSADAIAIRAVYKALVQRHHPDKPGNNKKSEEYLKELNEAYETLSNAGKRSVYDQHLEKHNNNASDYFSAEKPLNQDPLDNAWMTAKEYYPDLDRIFDDLNIISWSLGYSFKATILESKNFQNRHEISKNIKNEFLNIYFGSNTEIQKFAEYLLKNHYRGAAKDLNKAINIIGSSTDSERIIRTITKKHDIAAKDQPSEPNVDESVFLCVIGTLGIFVLIPILISIFI